MDEEFLLLLLLTLIVHACVVVQGNEVANHSLMPFHQISYSHLHPTIWKRGNRSTCKCDYSVGQVTRTILESLRPQWRPAWHEKGRQQIKVLTLLLCNT